MLLKLSISMCIGSRLGTTSIHQTGFATIQQPYVFEHSKNVANCIISIVSQVRKLKTERQLSLKTTLNTLTIHVPTIELGDALKKYNQIIKGVTQALEIIYEVNEIKESSMRDDGGNLHATVSCGE